MSDLHRSIVFKDEEVTLVQSCDESTAGVGHRGRHVDQLDATSKSEGVVIGRPCKYVDENDALDYVAGFCVINDVSEREWQIERGGQWDKR